MNEKKIDEIIIDIINNKFIFKFDNTNELIWELDEDEDFISIFIICIKFSIIYQEPIKMQLALSPYQIIFRFNENKAIEMAYGQVFKEIKFSEISYFLHENNSIDVPVPIIIAAIKKAIEQYSIKINEISLHANPEIQNGLLKSLNWRKKKIIELEKCWKRYLDGRISEMRSEDEKQKLIHLFLNK